MYFKSSLVLGDVSCLDVAFAIHVLDRWKHYLLLGDFSSGDQSPVLGFNVIIDFFYT